MKRQPHPAHIRPARVMLLSVMPGAQPRGMEGDGRLRLRVRDRRAGRFRVNAGGDRKGRWPFPRDPGQGRERRAARISKEVQQLCYLTKVSCRTGPTGSGKSTTLCSLIDPDHRTRTDTSSTIEDPIEFRHENKKCVITHASGGFHTDIQASAAICPAGGPGHRAGGRMPRSQTIAIAIGPPRRPPRMFGRCTDGGRPPRRTHIDQFPRTGSHRFGMCRSR